MTRLVAATIDAASVSLGLVVAYAGFNAVLFLINPRGFQFTRASALVTVGTVLAVVVVYLAAAWSLTGRTYGDHVMGLRVVGRQGGAVRPLIAIGRALFCVVFPIGLLWCAASTSRRSLQDAVLRTTVVYDWRPRQRGSSLAIP